MTRKIKNARDLKPGDKVYRKDGTLMIVKDAKPSPIAHYHDVEASTTIEFTHGTEATITSDETATDELWVEE